MNPSSPTPLVEKVARAMAQASGRDPDGTTAPPRGQLGTRKLWELYVRQAKGALEASGLAGLVHNRDPYRVCYEANEDKVEELVEALRAADAALRECGVCNMGFIEAALSKYSLNTGEGR